VSVASDPRLVADPREEPAFVARAPSGRPVEVVDRRTYERVTSLLSDRLQQAVDQVESLHEEIRLAQEQGDW
jgi:hypothetical protein